MGMLHWDMAATPSKTEDEEKYEVHVIGFEQVAVRAESRKEAMKKAADQTDFGDLATDTDEYRVERPGKTDKPLYNVYKNGELVEEEKPMSDAKANKLDGHTQFNEEEGDFEKFRVEEVN
jgi:hypothetical protein